MSLAKTRARRDKAREPLADGVDPSTAKRYDKQAKADAAAHTFEAVEHEVFPFIGKLAISALGPRDMLAALRKMEAPGRAG